MPGIDDVARYGERVTWLGRLGRLLGMGPTSGPDEGDDPGALTDPARRASWIWDRLVSTSMVRRGGNQVLVMDGPGRHAPVAAVWPLSQVLAAALDIDRLARLDADRRDRDGLDRLDSERPDTDRRSGSGSVSVDDLAATLELYRRGDGYATHPGAGERYFDDNAWVGLDAVQAHRQLHPGQPDSLWLHKAKRTFGVLVTGQDADGGVRWKEVAPGRPASRNTCSTAPTIELALALHELTGSSEALAVAERADGWLRRTLESPEGLFWDHVEADGQVEPTFWSYNQGTPVGAEVRWWRVTGDRAHLDRASALAQAALAHFAAGDRLWRQPPAFNAIFFRNLAQLHAADPQPAVVAALDQYLERVWVEARRDATGLFDAGGIGHYDDGGTLDRAALVQLYVVQALPREHLAELS